uniref:Hypothetical_protein n=1 Tax=Oryza glaberrima TaxID=4538 RepID=G2XLG4_ORYGL|nr:hypothetical_protein [Oryza glaberrima]
MAPRKPNLASATGRDPGQIDNDNTAFLGVSLVDNDELAKLVSSGAVVEGQAFAPGKAVVPKPGDNRTVVFAVFFKAGLRFPCNVLLPEILRLFQVELPQLSPSALVRIAIFDWACQTAGFEPSADLFGTGTGRLVRKTFRPLCELGFWQKDGRSTAKACLLEQLAKAEAANQGEEPTAGGGGGDAEDHPEGARRKLCIRALFGYWRSKNEKFIAVKGLPKVRCPFRPVYREMIINGNSYKVLKVASWMRAHPGRTLEDYDSVHTERREDMVRFWRNHQKSDRQEAIA